MIRATASVFLVLAAVAAAPAHSAAYLKFDGVKGETKGTQAAPSPGANVKSNEAPKPEALLVPAVQKVREAASRTEGTKKGNVEYGWKVEAGEK